MRNRTIHALMAGMLLLVGCGKSNTNSAQNATAPAAAPSNQTPDAAQGQAPAQAPTPEQAQAANPANAPAPPPEPPAPLVVPAGTTLPVILATSISSYKNKAVEDFEGNLAAPITVNATPAIDNSVSAPSAMPFVTSSSSESR